MRGDREICLIDAFVFLDPPYVVHGKELYKNAFAEKDHIKLFKTVCTLNNKWFVTYDDAPLIQYLYKNFRIDKFNITYTVQTKKTANELAIKSNNLI